MFFGDVGEEVKEYDDMNMREVAYMLPLCACVIVFGIFPAPILNMMKASVGQLVDLLAKF
jgi:NADH-quinone oxidoreductase subunit M